MHKPDYSLEQLERLGEQLVAICHAAGEEILKVYQHHAGIEVTTKGDDSPVTKADLAANAVIEASLQKLSPELPIVTEESSLITYDERQHWPRYWLVDPLDGTKEFIRKSGEFTVNIALIENHRPILGIVYVPTSGITYLGIVAKAAYKIVNGEKTQIKCRRISDSGEVSIVASSQHRNKETEMLIEHIGKQFSNMHFKAKGSSLKFCLLAEGEADIYPRMAPTCEWDTGAAQAVLEAAGGLIVDLDGQTLRYNTKASMLNPSFIAYADGNIDWIGMLSTFK